MTRFIGTTLKLFVFVVLGTVLVDSIFGDTSIKPNMMLIGLAILALAEGPFAATIGGFFMGLIHDASVPNLLGLHALFKALFGYGLGVYRTRMVRGVPLVEGLTIAACVLAHDALYLIVESGLQENDLMVDLLKAVPSALLTGALAVPMFRLAEFAGIMHRET